MYIRQRDAAFTIYKSDTLLQEGEGVGVKSSHADYVYMKQLKMREK